MERGQSGTHSNLSKIIKQQRVSLGITLEELAAKSGVSASHIGRVERGERFPSARVLQMLAAPLSFSEGEIMTLAGYLSPRPETATDERALTYGEGRLDPDVAHMLASESPAVQRGTIGILNILKNIGKSVAAEDK